MAIEIQTNEYTGRLTRLPNKTKIIYQGITGMEGLQPPGKDLNAHLKSAKIEKTEIAIGHDYNNNLKLPRGTRTVVFVHADANSLFESSNKSNETDPEVYDFINNLSRNLQAVLYFRGDQKLKSEFRFGDDVINPSDLINTANPE